MNVQEVLSTRDKLIAVAADLMERKGFFGLGINELLKTSGIPKGSLYHHFPGGKVALVEEAIKHSSKRRQKEYHEAMKGKKTVLEGIIAIIDTLKEKLENTDFQYVCPISIIALEGADGNQRIRESCKTAFEELETNFKAYLNLNGMDDAEYYAKVIINMIEGGILLAKAHHDIEHLETIKRYLPKLLKQ